ncbi:MAG: pilus assembly protein TadG-related protein, partial [Pseudomonadota bacterium]
MKNLKKICLRFAADRSGNIAIATGIAIVPLTLAIGVAVDYSMISNRKAHIQHALDTAALATAKNLGLVKSRAELKDLARSYFYANLNGLKPTDVKLVFHDSNTAGGTAIELSAYMDYKMLFGSLYEKKQRRIQKSSIVKTGNNSLEIALVLDNSGSMNWNNRIGTAKKAATGLINQLTEAFETSTHPAPVKFSVVPFTGHVNVGQQHARALWMDTTGLSPIHHENLNWQQNPRARAYGDGRWRDGSGRWLTRFSLFSDMIGVRWSGCVEARPWPHHTRDTSPNPAQPATLYVPAFAPDEPDNYSGQRQVSRSNPVYCSRTNRRKKCKLWSDGYRRNVHHTGARANTDLRNYTRQYMRLLDRSGNPFGGFDAAGGLVRNGPRISEERYSNSYLADDKNVPAPLHAYSAANTGRGAKQNARQDWTWKYSGQGPRVGSFVGPNHGCTGNPITALTTSKNRVISAINTMRANGYTNVPLGIAWGWRTLSPGQPFPEGRA